MPDQAHLPRVEVANVASPTFARLIVARLGAAGILAMVQGPSDGILPLIGNHRVLVTEEDAPLAQAILAAPDQGEMPDEDWSEQSSPARTGRPPARRWGWIVSSALVILCLALYLHMA